VPKSARSPLLISVVAVVALLGLAVSAQNPATPTVADFATGLATPLAGPPIQGPVVAVDINGDGMDDIVAPARDGLGVVAYLSHA